MHWFTWFNTGPTFTYNLKDKFTIMRIFYNISWSLIFHNIMRVYNPFRLKRGEKNSWSPHEVEENHCLKSPINPPSFIRWYPFYWGSINDWWEVKFYVTYLSSFALLSLLLLPYNGCAILGLRDLPPTLSIIKIVMLYIIFLFDFHPIK